MLSAVCAAVLTVSLTGCGNGTVGEPETTVSTTGQAAAPIQAEASTGGKQGYGQGVQVDDANRPIGALDFNAKYGGFNAVAIGEEGEKIRLTFDQGYENGYTAKILDTLKEKHVQAIFFVVQDYAERNPELVRRMIDEGHIIGNHSVTHRSMPELTAAECAEEINGLNRYMQENFGVTPTLFRPPMGEFSDLSLAVTKQCGCKTMMWSYAYADWNVDAQPAPAEAMTKLLRASHEGAIYLLHSVSATNAQILGDFIDQLRAKGYELY